MTLDRMSIDTRTDIGLVLSHSSWVKFSLDVKQFSLSLSLFVRRKYSGLPKRCRVSLFDVCVFGEDFDMTKVTVTSYCD